MTGQSREPLIGFIINAGKAVMIVTIATSGALYNSWVVDTIDDFRDEVTYLITGSNQDVYRQVDKNLALTQSILSTINTVAKSTLGHAPKGEEATAEAKKAWWIGAFGGAGPAVVGGMVSLLNEIMLHFAIMLGPLFILGLLFEQTKQLFWQWVKSVLGLMLSMGVLAFLSGLVMKITIGYGTAIATAIAVNKWFPGVNGIIPMPSVVDTMMMQGGIGLLLTTMLITIPPAVSQFVGGTLGAGVSGFGPWSSGNPAKGQDSNGDSNQNNRNGGSVVQDQGSVVPNPLGSNKPNLNAPVDPGSGNAPVSNSPPEQQLAVVNRNLANQGYGLTTSGNLYTMTTSSATNVQNAAMADAGNGPPPASISAEVKALAARGQELQQQVAAAK